MIKFFRYIKCNVCFETLPFILVFFSNFEVGSLLMTDIIYVFLTVYAWLKYPHYKKDRILVVFVFFIIAMINYLRFSHFQGFFSSMRFIYGMATFLVFSICFENRKSLSKALDGYFFSVTIFSLVVIVQFVSYYGVGVNLNIDFGDFAREKNAASAYDPLLDLFYRTGGLFKEPSWFAAYVSPACFILTIRKRYKELLICLLGLLLSTSGVGFMVLAIYAAWLSLKYDLRLGIGVVSLFLVAFWALPVIFTKMLGGIEDGSFGSFGIRVGEPFEIINQSGIIGFIGCTPSFHYASDGTPNFFCNTALFVYLYFGIIGCLLFLRLIFFKRFVVFTFVILIIMIVEGLYGRIDFWMMLLCCELFHNTLSIKRQNALIAGIKNK